MPKCLQRNVVVVAVVVAFVACVYVFIIITSITMGESGRVWEHVPVCIVRKSQAGEGVL